MAKTKQPTDLIPVSDAAVILNRHVSQAYEHISAGRLTEYLVDGKVHVSEAEVRALPAPRRGRPKVQR